MCRRTSTAWKNILGTMAVQLQKWHQCDLARTGWLLQTSKTTAGWWLPSNLRSMPLGMACQIKYQDSRQGIFHLPTSSNTKLDRLGTPVSACKFAASLFCTAQFLCMTILNRGSCPKAAILGQPALMLKFGLKGAKKSARPRRTILEP